MKFLTAVEINRTDRSDPLKMLIGTSVFANSNIYRFTSLVTVHVIDFACNF